jgi:2-oxoglutarate decarboxylase
VAEQRTRSSRPESEPGEGFGANGWLVDEMYDRFTEDPDSVDPAWHEFFAGHVPGQDGPRQNGSAHANGSAHPNGAGPTGSAPQDSLDTPPVEAVAAAVPAAGPADRPTDPVDGTVATGPDTGPDTGRAASAPVPAEAPEVARATADAHGLPAALAAGSPPAPTVARPATPAVDRAQIAPDGSRRPTAGSEPSPTVLRGPAARVATNMAASLSVPTATSVRDIPVKLLIDNRTVINRQLSRSRGGKVSFTHLIAYALVRAIGDTPGMNDSYAEVDGRPAVLRPTQVNLGIAIDLPRPDGTRQLLVPSIKAADTLGFAAFWAGYEDLVRRARTNALTVADFAGTTVSLTNPGGLGTVHSIPRLMAGQAVIIGVGAMEYPAGFQGASAERISEIGVARTMTLTSTYDHRVIQGALSGELLRRMHQLLLGEDGFYDDVFAELRIPTEPFRWAQDNIGPQVRVGKQARVIELIHAYRVRGHLIADTDPLEFHQRTHPDLQLATHGLTIWDLDRRFATGGFGPGDADGQRDFMTLRDILELLRDSYSGTVGTEYMHVHDPVQRRWIQDRVERLHSRADPDDQLRVLAKLNEAEAFETFLQTKFVGQRRFSLEGGESLIPLLARLCSGAARAQLSEVCIGMSHRGRLNVLANIVGKSYDHIFREFEGNIDPATVQGSGDVKYHLGSNGVFAAATGATIGVSVAANPSHLEAVDPVLEGIVRAKQDVLDRGTEYPVLPLLVHGDAAFAGQGVVAETLNLSQLRGYRTGGTIHVIVNNQVGFTTDPAAGRSSTYCTDVARMIQAPIFHVNGDDPEACVRVAQLAFDYRQRFHRDVVIDLVCYRRRGHNEGDDPSMTQPHMYDLIERKRSVRKLYTEALVGRGDISVEQAEQALEDYNSRLERNFALAKQTFDHPELYHRVPDYPLKPTPPGGDGRAPVTAISPGVLARIAEAHRTPPAGFTLHAKVAPQLERRAAAFTGGEIDWATAEAAAFGSLLLDGRSVRLVGQDSRRGTFVQRFAVLMDRGTNESWTPLKGLESPGGAKFHIYDSLLSEFAAVGFEYGYSVARPAALVMWEAQFGDFANGAQSIADEFIAGGEAKWGQHSGVVLLLPHGFEGQGPDHSSARIERWLQLAADDVFTVAQPSTPASWFHLLRRHCLASAHRPLIVATPKSMLRNKAAVSAADDLTGGRFEPVLDDGGAGAGGAAPDPAGVRRVLLCSGKIAWDLAAARTRREDRETAIVRLEQLYPIPHEGIRSVIGRYPDAEVRWVQDEPANQGAWPSLYFGLLPGLDRAVTPVTRPVSAVPAVGATKAHAAEQAALLEAAFA